ncbi:hypothetical protein C7H19_09695 [Aphanothece hegewaldii CCALA 016]|uniref:Glycosyl hydrolase-like 10 domain-containing protein n=1 Tax=Aphanothece hegewaldii CCALA 016 TaxID=2107694 RepID=A0A2T1LYG7_9CHRO|nr:family 10 glycosylhydrolase [Aphanothece hegewaldii]PSF37435.1 hypothetical protein C7H19_09695 [Aphanothece hegewaldii CCALA 016]
MLFKSNTQKFKLSLVTLFVVIVTYFLLKPAPSIQRTAKEFKTIRGVWLTDIGTAFLHHTTLLDNVLNHLSRSGYNRIYVNVYGDWGTLYPSHRKVRNTGMTSLFLSPPLTNPLKYVAKEGKRQGLKVYAWLEYGLILSPNSQIAKSHPDWLLKTPDGKTVIDHFVWLDPSHPEVQDYILSMVEEIIKYDLEGIQFDDHWAIPVQFGYHQQSLTNLTQKVYQLIQEKNPKLIFSLSPNPYAFSVNRYNQNWIKWINKGYIDEVVVQVYRKTPTQVQQSINTSGVAEASRFVPVAIGVFAPWDTTEKEIKEQIKVVNESGYGFSVFCWERRFISSLLEMRK